MHKLLFLFFAFLGAGVSAQDMFGRNDRSLVDFPRHKNSGWLVEPGATWMLGRFVNREETYTHEDNDYNLTIDPGGKIGAYLGVGRYHFFYEGGRVFNYYDYSLAYKMLRGKEEITGDLTGEGKYSHNFLLGNFNVNNIIQLTDYTFIQNSIGANIDWRFITRSEHEQPLANNSPSKITGSIHYKIGYGIKVTKKLFVIPQLETPILNVHNFENFKSTWGIFNSRHRPLIFSVRLAWLRPLGRGDCPPVYGNPDDKDTQNNFNMR